MGKTHVLAGLGLYLTGRTLLAPDAIIHPAEFVAVFLGSLIPDIDHPKSWVGRRLWFISYPLSGIIGHRGLTHSLCGLAIISIALATVLFLNAIPFDIKIITIAFAVGYLSHILCDYNTNTGVPFLWPIKSKMKSPWAFNTGSPLEYLLSLFMAILIFIFLKPETPQSFPF